MFQVFTTSFLLFIYIIIVIHIGHQLNTSIPIINSDLFTIIETIFLLFTVTYILRKTKIFESNDKNIIYYKNDFNKAQTLKAYFIAYSISTMFGIYGITYINVTYFSKINNIAIYKVVDIGKHYFPYMAYPYVKLKNNSNTIIYSPKNLDSFQISQEVNLTIQHGILGFEYISDINKYDREI